MANHGARLRVSLKSETRYDLPKGSYRIVECEDRKKWHFSWQKKTRLFTANHGPTGGGTDYDNLAIRTMGGIMQVIVKLAASGREIAIILGCILMRGLVSKNLC